MYTSSDTNDAFIAEGLDAHEAIKHKERNIKQKDFKAI